jgi:hypothetical protein
LIFGSVKVDDAMIASIFTTASLMIACPDACGLIEVITAR